ncbi:MAG: SH3 domain-containing protein [Actinomycetota bacterium]
MKTKPWIAMLLVVAVVAAACSPGDDETGRGTAEAGGSATSSPIEGDEDASDEASPDDATAGGADGDPADGDGATDGDAPATGADPDGEAPSGGDALVWTVVGVEWDDTLNVRAEPNASAPVVTELAPWATDLAATGAVGGDGSRWRQLVLDDGSTGWVNGRFLVGQPVVLDADDESDLAAQGERFLVWAESRAGAEPSSLVVPAGVWVGGIGIYADAGSEWNWLAAEELATTADWDVERSFVVGQGIECGAECVLSTRDFLNLDRIDDTSRVLINDIADENQAHLEGMLWEAPRSMYRVVIDTPSSDPDQFFDWQRLHLVPDWSTGDVAFKLIHNHGWTP